MYNFFKRKLKCLNGGFRWILGEFSGGSWCSKFGKCLWFLAVVTAILLGEVTKFRTFYPVMSEEHFSLSNVFADQTDKLLIYKIT